MQLPGDVGSMLYGVGTMILGGGIVHAFNKYIARSDSQERTLPVVTQSIETMTKCIESMNASIKELCESRDKHNVELAEINTMHRVLKCADKFDKVG